MNIMMKLKTNKLLETYENYFHKKGHDALTCICICIYIYVYIYIHINFTNYSTRYKIKIKKEIADTEMTPIQKTVKTLLINTKSSEDNNPVTQDNKSIRFESGCQLCVEVSSLQ